MAEQPNVKIDMEPHVEQMLKVARKTHATLQILPIMADVVDEQIRARELHGEQKHLDFVTPRPDGRYYGAEAEQMKAFLGDESVPATWDLIALEEVYEFLAELEKGDLAAARVEGIQAIAMLTSMIELIDGRLDS